MASEEEKEHSSLEGIASPFNDFQLFKNLMGRLPITFWTTDKELKIVHSFGAKVRENISGSADAGLKGISLYDIFETTDPSHPGLGAHLNAFKTKEPIQYETEFSGRYFTAYVQRWEKDNKVIGVFGVAIDITEDRMRERELRRSNLDLTRFAFCASHDLKEPARLLANYAALLTSGEKSKFEPVIVERLQFIEKESQRLIRLIDAMLSYSRVNASPVNIGEVDVQELVTDVIASLKQFISEKSATVDVEKLPKVYADRALLAQVFQNLIVNGIKYNESKKRRVSISAKKSDKEVTFFVSDNGSGIENRFLGQIFVAFNRIHGKDKYEGEGIGLSLCKRVLEMHNGKIWVESNPEKGSTFYFSLPIPQKAKN